MPGLTRDRQKCTIFDSMTPKVQIVLAMIASAMILGVIFVVVWINRGTDKTPGILIKSVAAPLALALALLGAEIFADLPKDQATAELIVLRNDEGLVAPIHDRLMLSGSDYGSGYRILRHVMRAWSEARDPKFTPASSEPEKMEFVLDATELAFLQWLAWNYSGHWDMDLLRTYSVSGTGQSGRPTEGAEATPLRLTISKVAGENGNSLLHHLVQPMVLGLPDRFALPSGSTISVSRSPGVRTITIKNAEVILVVSLSAGSYGDLGATDMANAIMAAWPNTHWKEYQVHANLVAEYSHLRRWSPRRTRQQRWIAALMAGFRADFDWPTLRRDLLATLHARPHI